MTLASALLAELDDQALDALADLLAPRLRSRIAGDDGEQRSPWLNAEQAARHLACPRGRIHDLAALGLLKPRRDGRRLLFKRADLDAYLERSA